MAAQNAYKITTAGVVPQTLSVVNATTTVAPYPITGTVTADAINPYVLQYAGSTPLATFGPLLTAIGNNVLPGSKAVDGETGLNDQNVQLNGYAYLYIPGQSKVPYKIVRVLGIYQTQTGPTTYTASIHTDTDNTGISAQAFEIVFGKLVGYSIINTGATNGTISVQGSLNSATLYQGNNVDEAQLAPASDRTVYLKPVYVDPNSGEFTIVENT